MKTMPAHIQLRARQRGLNLIELMVAMAISLVLLMGITSLIVSQNHSRDELEKSSRQIENGRYAMQLLHTDLQQAGFYGLYYQLPPYGQSLGLAAYPPALPDPCDLTITGMSNALPLTIQGYNNALPAANFTCALDGVNAANNAANYLPGTDILVIRRTLTDSTPVTFTAAVSGAASNTTTPLVAGQVYLQTIGNSAVMGVGAGATDTTNNYPLYLSTRQVGTLIYAPLRRYSVHVYFISPCSVPANGSTSCTGNADDNGRPTPTLKELELTVNAAGQPVFNLVPLVEGIENMQLEYGVDSDNTVAAASSVDGYPETYCTNPDVTATCQTPGNLLPFNASNPTNWQNTVAVRVSLLARNTECTTNYTDTKSYTLGSLAASAPAAAPAVPCTNGGYKRHVFSELVRLVNPSGRRAQE